MRTTLSIDDDVFAFARERAQRERISIGEALSKLAREGIRTQHSFMGKTVKPKSKYALLPARNESITTEHVRDLMDQEGM